MDFTRSVAIHEAGHAVIARVLTLPRADSVTIVWNEHDMSAGHAMTGDPEITEGEWDAAFGESRGRYRAYGAAMRAHNITSMAAAEAEVLVMGCCNGGDGDDRDQIARMLYYSRGPRLMLSSA